MKKVEKYVKGKKRKAKTIIDKTIFKDDEANIRRPYQKKKSKFWEILTYNNSSIDDMVCKLYFYIYNFLFLYVIVKHFNTLYYFVITLQLQHNMAYNQENLREG